ncbi:MAG: VOC family protein [Niabella sp.]
MKNNIYPCIWCNHNAKEMAGLYCSVFPDTKIIAENPVVIMLSIKEQNLMLLNGGKQFQPTPAFSLMYLTADAQEVETIYNKLIDGGKPLMPLGSYPFSEKYGWLDDKYGVSWQLYSGKAENITQSLVPTLMFLGDNNGKAKEAATFYTAIFPNSKITGMLAYTGSEGEIAGNIQHGEFLINQFLVGLMDSSINHQFIFSEGMSLVVNCANQTEIDNYWNALTADGGADSQCGWLKDKYGISWQIIPENISSLISQSPKAMQALLKMKKIIIADLVAAGVE